MVTSGALGCKAGDYALHAYAFQHRFQLALGSGDFGVLCLALFGMVSLGIGVRSVLPASGMSQVRDRGGCLAICA